MLLGEHAQLRLVLLKQRILLLPQRRELLVGILRGEGVPGAQGIGLLGMLFLQIIDRRFLRFVGSLQLGLMLLGQKIRLRLVPIDERFLVLPQRGELFLGASLREPGVLTFHRFNAPVVVRFRIRKLLLECHPRGVCLARVILAQVLQRCAVGLRHSGEFLGVILCERLDLRLVLDDEQHLFLAGGGVLFLQCLRVLRVISLQRLDVPGMFRFRLCEVFLEIAARRVCLRGVLFLQIRERGRVRLLRGLQLRAMIQTQRLGLRLVAGCGFFQRLLARDAGGDQRGGERFLFQARGGVLFLQRFRVPRVIGLQRLDALRMVRVDVRGLLFKIRASVAASACAWASAVSLSFASCAWRSASICAA